MRTFFSMMTLWLFVIILSTFTSCKKEPEFEYGKCYDCIVTDFVYQVNLYTDSTAVIYNRDTVRQLCTIDSPKGNLRMDTDTVQPYVFFYQQSYKCEEP